MHFYVEGSKTGQGKCHDSFNGARDEILGLLLKKAGTAPPHRLREAAEALGEVAGWYGWDDEEYEIALGSDTWWVKECHSYTCKDTLEDDGW